MKWSFSEKFEGIKVKLEGQGYSYKNRGCFKELEGIMVIVMEKKGCS